MPLDTVGVRSQYHRRFRIVLLNVRYIEKARIL
jgi:hypothetical protein